MAASKCPICYAPLELRDVAPCFDCGADPAELLHLSRGLHTYDEVQTFGETIVLCNCCQEDFWSYKPAYFGLPRHVQPGRSIAFQRKIINPRVSKDHYCSECGHRLAFLQFVARVRSAKSL